MKIRVHITLKNGVLDPQGKAISNALGTLGFAGINNVRQGKFIEIDVAEDNPDKAREAAEAMCRKLLANTVIEDYQIDLDPGNQPSSFSRAQTVTVTFKSR